MKSLLDECIRQRKAGLPLSIPTPPQSSSNIRGRETEKNLDRLKRDLSQMVPGVTSKKPRLDLGGSGSGRLSSNMTPSPTASVPLEEPDEMDLDLYVTLTIIYIIICVEYIACTCLLSNRSKQNRYIF